MDCGGGFGVLAGVKVVEALFGEGAVDLEGAGELAVRDLGELEGDCWRGMDGVDARFGFR